MFSERMRSIDCSFFFLWLIFEIFSNSSLFYRSISVYLLYRK